MYVCLNCCTYVSLPSKNQEEQACSDGCRNKSRALIKQLH
jgi:transcription initiation factor IIE alpha subunit